MADININPINDQGLAQLAGGVNIPNLNLKNTSEGLLQKAQLQQQQNQLANAMAIAQLQQSQDNYRSQLQAGVSLQNNQLTNQTNAQNNQNTNSTLSQNNINTNLTNLANNQNTNATNMYTSNNRLAVQQGQLNLDNWYKQNQISDQQQQLHMTAVKNQFDMNMQQTKEQLAQNTQIMSNYQAQAMKITDPAQLASLQAQTIQQRVKQGLITPQQALEESQMNPDQLNQEYSLQGGVAKEAMNYKMMGAQAVTHKITNTDGSTTSTTSYVFPQQSGQSGQLNGQPTGQPQVGQQGGPLTQGTLGKLQGQQIGAQRAVSDITSQMNAFDPQLYTTEGQGEANAGRIAGQVAPGVFGSQMATTQANMHNITLQSMMDTLSQQTGVRFNAKTLETLAPEMPKDGLNPVTSDSPETAFSKVAGLYQRMQSANKIANQLRSQGLSSNDPSYTQQVENALKQQPANVGKFTIQGADGKTQVYDYAATKQFYEQHQASQQNPQGFTSFGQAMTYLAQHSI